MVARLDAGILIAKHPYSGAKAGREGEVDSAGRGAVAPLAELRPSLKAPTFQTCIDVDGLGAREFGVEDFEQRRLASASRAAFGIFGLAARFVAIYELTVRDDPATDSLVFFAIVST